MTIESESDTDRYCRRCVDGDRRTNPIPRKAVCLRSVGAGILTRCDGKLQKLQVGILKSYLRGGK